MSQQRSLNSRHALPGRDDITRFELPNGIVILTRANFDSPSVVLTGYLPAGSLFDPDEKLGLADFTASSLMRGTARRDFQQIYDALETVGASLGFGGGTHNAEFSGRALAEDLDLLLELLADALRQPVFPQEQISRLRAQMLTGLAIRDQDTGEVASLAFDQILYNGHPYSRPDDGYSETVSNVTREDLEEFHRCHYGPNGLVISLVGAVEADQVSDKITAVLGDWKNPRQFDLPALPPVKPLAESLRKTSSLPGKSQADILLGAVGPARQNLDYLAASLGNNILGQFGMYGRIGDAVREREGLAYYAYSSVSGGLGPGPWYVSAGVNPANIERSIELVLEELRRFVSQPVTEEELADSKANFIGRLPLSMESNAGVAGALLSLERYNLDLDYFRIYPDLIRAITLQQVLEAARHYLDPDRLGISVAGPG